MVRADLRLTRAHDAWARRRLLAAVAEVREKHPDPTAINSLRTLALALGEEGIAAWADKCAVGMLEVPGNSESGGIVMPPAELPLATRESPVLPPSSVPAPASDPRNPGKPLPVCLRLLSASRAPRARHAWIVSVLRTAAIESTSEDGFAIRCRPGTAAAAAWLERLSTHPEIEVSR